MAAAEATPSRVAATMPGNQEPAPAGVAEFSARVGAPEGFNKNSEPGILGRREGACWQIVGSTTGNGFSL